ncbi:hypothetical protein MPTA5024_37480 [Microbispora sp. ATCC PTA-5024]|nr:hypothetical protein MPTA5024_37480 [Microbispora sp. ATCC PTA-5024]
MAALTAKDRAELRHQQVQGRLQMVTTLTVVLGVAFTALGLIYTARTLEATQQAQVTDRYAKSVEQLGNKDSLDSRIGAIYALGRLATDSARDGETIAEVLSAFVREHVRRYAQGKRQAAPVPDGDVLAALSVLARRLNPDHKWSMDLQGLDAHGLDLNGLDLRRADLNHARMSDVHLEGARLEQARLEQADLTKSHLGDVHLDGADLRGARLIEAYSGGGALPGADLRDAYLSKAHIKGADMRRVRLDGADLNGAVLSGSDLTGATLTGADLTDADLTNVKLTNARLDDANLIGASLYGTDLHGVTGIDPAEVRRIAKTNATTKF